MVSFSACILYAMPQRDAQPQIKVTDNIKYKNLTYKEVTI